MQCVFLTCGQKRTSFLITKQENLQKQTIMRRIELDYIKVKNFWLIKHCTHNQEADSKWGEGRKLTVSQSTRQYSIPINQEGKDRKSKSENGQKRAIGNLQTRKSNRAKRNRAAQNTRHPASLTRVAGVRKGVMTSVGGLWGRAWSPC